MKKAVLCFALLIGLAAVGVAQLPTITNATLEKYQQQRLAALREYRENYAKMGFPSPEELDRQREADMNARIDLAEQLRQARLEEEKIGLQARSLDLQAEALAYREAPVEEVGSGEYYGGYYGGNAGYYGGNAGYGGYYGGYSEPYWGGYYNRGRYGRRYGRYGRYNGVWPGFGGYRATAVGAYPGSSGAPLPTIRRRAWGR